MPEPSTTAVVGITAATASAISLLPGIDGNALVGAFCGALLFAASAHGLSLPTRLIYLLISFAIGYLGGPAVLGDFLKPSAVSAFIGAAITVTAGLRAIEGIKTLDLRTWLGGKK